MKNIWKNLTSFVDRFHKNKIFIAFLIIFAVAISFFNYDCLVKNSIVYPSIEYSEFETFALNHFKNIKAGVIEKLPDNIDYNFRINNRTVEAHYTAKTEIPLFETMPIDVSQYLANDKIEITRYYTEKNYKIKFGFAWILYGLILGVFAWFVFSTFCYIVRFINLIINKFSKKKNEKHKKIKKDLTTLEKAALGLKKYEEKQENEKNQDIIKHIKKGL